MRRRRVSLPEMKAVHSRTTEEIRDRARAQTEATGGMEAARRGIEERLAASREIGEAAETGLLEIRAEEMAEAARREIEESLDVSREIGEAAETVRPLETETEETEEAVRRETEEMAEAVHRETGIRGAGRDRRASARISAPLSLLRLRTDRNRSGAREKGKTIIRRKISAEMRMEWARERKARTIRSISWKGHSRKSRSTRKRSSLL